MQRRASARRGRSSHSACVIKLTLVAHRIAGRIGGHSR